MSIKWRIELWKLRTSLISPRETTAGKRDGMANPGSFTCGTCCGFGVWAGSTCYRCGGTGMKEYILKNGKAEEDTKMTPEMINGIIRIKDFNPFWLFRDCSGTQYKNVYPFWCFLNAHYPEGLVSGDPEHYVEAVDAIDNGQWLLEQKRANQDLKIGWGNATSPDKAFESALRCAGYLKQRAQEKVVVATVAGEKTNG